QLQLRRPTFVRDNSELCHHGHISLNIHGDVFCLSACGSCRPHNQSIRHFSDTSCWRDRNSHGLPHPLTKFAKRRLLRRHSADRWNNSIESSLLGPSRPSRRRTRRSYTSETLGRKSSLFFFAALALSPHWNNNRLTF